MSKRRVAVLRGGPSEEYSVSLKTGSAVLDALPRDRYIPIDVTITKTGEWLVDGRVRYPEHVLNTTDVVFIALHGTYGEDGTVQRIIERFGVPYTGSSAYSSRIGMHKVLTKEHLKHTKIKLPKHFVVRQVPDVTLHRSVETIASLFGPHYFVKPIASGSSVDVTLVESAADLRDVLAEALSRHHEVMVEERIVGREATCGVVERFRGEDLYALPPIEIIPPPQAAFFDSAVKYDGTTQEVCPSNLPHETKKELEAAAKLVHQTLHLSQYSRSDFMVREDGVYFLEVNTLPGLTNESLLPKAISAVGGTYSGFVAHLIDDALAGKR